MTAINPSATLGPQAGPASRRLPGIKSAKCWSRSCTDRQSESFLKIGSGMARMMVMTIRQRPSV